MIDWFILRLNLTATQSTIKMITCVERVKERGVPGSHSRAGCGSGAGGTLSRLGLGQQGGSGPWRCRLLPLEGWPCRVELGRRVEE